MGNRSLAVEFSLYKVCGGGLERWRKMGASTPDRELVRGWIGQRTQLQAGKELGCSDPFVSMWLGGQRELSIRNCKRWAEVIAPVDSDPQKHSNVLRTLVEGVLGA